MIPGSIAANTAPAHLVLSGVGHRFGSFTALAGVDLTVRRGEFVTLLGPSGSGKTTLLRAIAGLAPPTEGSIRQDGADVTAVPVERRDVGIVFQSYALFPTLSVADNITYGLRALSRAARRDRLDAMLTLIGLTAHAGKYPGQLSGGQQQRVALARALAPGPGLLLLDEPLSALDAEVRRDLRGELRRLQRQLGITTLMVTHDQEEALTLSDRIMVLSQGKVEQVGSPVDLYDRPASLFVAGFIGAMNRLPLTSAPDGSLLLGPWPLPGLELGNNQPGQAPVLCLRPEWLGLDDAALDRPQIDDGHLCLPGRVTDSEYRGAQIMVQLALDAPELAGLSLTSLQPAWAGAVAGGDLAPGRRLRLRLPLGRLRLFADGVAA
ncbi:MULTISPECIES: ABC transporter ATP-binding protein [unclassified Azospirillum]|uniref:ABC transporter ATP-binding protein n=1 Tax=unclassified Azospirillum TaxID=2630922 RepID=UPI000B6AC2E4|nr:MULTISPECIES: ATP-binding cassette domain-containing protein [unclassified Azospirillum]SNS14056.1 iron(III) transport system ATP-binding protein [Azospirillum sp. RU38E]SNS31207.1 iron(III) transport system ATP-binding protein [Azospirillum sp. RU37A]